MSFVICDAFINAWPSNFAGFTLFSKSNIHLGVNAFRILAWVLVLTPHFANFPSPLGLGGFCNSLSPLGLGDFSKSLSPLGLGGTLLVLAYVTAGFGWRHVRYYDSIGSAGPSS